MSFTQLNSFADRQASALERIANILESTFEPSPIQQLIDANPVKIPVTNHDKIHNLRQRIDLMDDHIQEIADALINYYLGGVARTTSQRRLLLDRLTHVRDDTYSTSDESNVSDSDASYSLDESNDVQRDDEFLEDHAQELEDMCRSLRKHAQHIKMNDDTSRWDAFDDDEQDQIFADTREKWEPRRRQPGWYIELRSLCDERNS